jgi:hypothetical protein
MQRHEDAILLTTNPVPNLPTCTTSSCSSQPAWHPRESPGIFLRHECLCRLRRSRSLFRRHAARHATPRSSCRCSGPAKYLPSPLFWLFDWSLDAVRCGRQVPRAQIQNLAASTSIVFSSFLPLLSHDHNYNCDHTTAIIHTDDNYKICLILPLPTTTAHHHRSPLLPTARHRLLPPPKSQYTYRSLLCLLTTIPSFQDPERPPPNLLPL